eukprot:GHVR01088285.1.p1 GENE.GHVR01088285.1~~GHVR01088285.1.p1  ORF type:complete len:130 (+),score=0.72 GHVR01088285.1:247-636(+)
MVVDGEECCDKLLYFSLEHSDRHFKDLYCNFILNFGKYSFVVTHVESIAACFLKMKKLDNTKHLKFVFSLRFYCFYHNIFVQIVKGQSIAKIIHSTLSFFNFLLFFVEKVNFFIVQTEQIFVHNELILE